MWDEVDLKFRWKLGGPYEQRVKNTLIQIMVQRTRLFFATTHDSKTFLHCEQWLHPAKEVQGTFVSESISRVLSRLTRLGIVVLPYQI